MKDMLLHLWVNYEIPFMDVDTKKKWKEIIAHAHKPCADCDGYAVDDKGQDFCTKIKENTLRCGFKFKEG